MIGQRFCKKKKKKKLNTTNTKHMNKLAITEVAQNAMDKARDMIKECPDAGINWADILDTELTQAGYEIDYDATSKASMNTLAVLVDGTGLWFDERSKEVRISN